jgi:hypothetical protein
MSLTSYEKRALGWFNYGDFENEEYHFEPELVDYFVRHRHDKIVRCAHCLYPGLVVVVDKNAITPPLSPLKTTFVVEFLSVNRDIHCLTYSVPFKILDCGDMDGNGRIPLVGTVGQDPTLRSGSLWSWDDRLWLYSRYLFHRDGVRVYQELTTILPTLSGLYHHPYFDPMIFQTLVRDYLYDSRE